MNNFLSELRKGTFCMAHLHIENLSTHPEMICACAHLHMEKRADARLFAWWCARKNLKKTKVTTEILLEISRTIERK